MLANEGVCLRPQQNPIKQLRTNTKHYVPERFPSQVMYASTNSAE